MSPYPQSSLDNKKRIFNYRVSRARKSVEYAFGMLTQKFQVLLTMIRCRNPDTVNSIVKCACVLHNSFIPERAYPIYASTTMDS